MPNVAREIDEERPLIKEGENVCLACLDGAVGAPQVRDVEGVGYVACALGNFPFILEPDLGGDIGLKDSGAGGVLDPDVDDGPDAVGLWVVGLAADGHDFSVKYNWHHLPSAGYPIQSGYDFLCLRVAPQKSSIQIECNNLRFVYY